jgi:hypothetical protein
MLLSDIFEAFSAQPVMKFTGMHATEHYRGMFDTRFSVNGETYLVSISQDAYDDYFTEVVWSVEFRALSVASYRPNNQAGMNAPAVFGGVSSAIIKFIDEEAPDAIGFTGLRKDRLGQLYAKMVRHMAPRIAALGYRLDTDVISGSGGEMDVILLYRGNLTDFVKE